MRREPDNDGSDKVRGGHCRQSIMNLVDELRLWSGKVTKGSDIAEDKLEPAIRRHIDQPELPRKSLMSRLLDS